MGALKLFAFRAYNSLLVDAPRDRNIFPKVVN